MMSALNLPLSGIQSTLGRILCRAHEAQWAAGKLQYFFDKLMTNLKNGNLATASMEVGPLARTLIAYHKGDAATVESVIA